MNNQEWNQVYCAFLKTLAEHQGRALAGDHRSQQIVSEYGLQRWSGSHPLQALRIAESMYDARQVAL